MRSPFKTYQWKSNKFACQSNDIEHFRAMFDEEIMRLDMQKKELGSVYEHPIAIYRNEHIDADLPSVLICAGFHGEEAAANWGMLDFISQLQTSVFQSVNLSLLPLVNPTGFIKGYRCNKKGQNPNRGFEFINGQSKASDITSDEGLILLKYAKFLQTISKDGVLTCHEDILQNETYIYSFEPRPSPGKFSLSMRDKLTEFFPLITDQDIDGLWPTEGIIFNHFDTSFEAFLVRSGSRVGVCSETPALADFDQRIAANSALMQTFVNYIIANH